MEVLASTQLSHPNIVPFLGVYSTFTHPLALLYKLMDNLDLYKYLVQHPNINRLKLVSIAFAVFVMGSWLTPNSSSSLRSHMH